MRRYNLNPVQPKMKADKRKIIKQKAGGLGHMDCHHLSRDLFPGQPRHYLVCLLDDCTRRPGNWVRRLRPRRSRWDF